MRRMLHFREMRYDGSWRHAHKLPMRGSTELVLPRSFGAHGHVEIIARAGRPPAEDGIAFECRHPHPALSQGAREAGTSVTAGDRNFQDEGTLRERGAVADFYADAELLLIAQNYQRHVFADLRQTDQEDQVAIVLDGYSVEF